MPEVTDHEIEMTQKVLREVKERLKEHQLRRLRAAVRPQRLAAGLGGERTTGPDKRVLFSIRPEFYHYWGQRLGYECWEDEQFVREMQRDNPEIRVRCHTGNIMVGWQSGGKRFTKSYG